MKSRTAALVVALALTLGAGPVAACQSAVPNANAPSDLRTADALAYYKLLREARAHEAARDFAKAAAQYQQLAEANPEDGENWLRLARSRYRLGEYRAAIEAYKKANELGFGFVQYNSYMIACAYARLGDKKNALVWLEKALDEQRFENRPLLRQARPSRVYARTRVSGNSRACHRTVRCRGMRGGATIWTTSCRK